MSAAASDHYAKTMGAVPAALATLREFDPALFEHLTALRRLAYGEDVSVDGSGTARTADGLDAAARELVFVVIAAVVNNPPGARAHLRAGAAHGLRLEQVRQALLVVMFERGAHGWVDGVSAVWDAAVEELG